MRVAVKENLLIRLSYIMFDVAFISTALVKIFNDNAFPTKLMYVLSENIFIICTMYVYFFNNKVDFYIEIDE